jgi:glycosyltransferase involved in cell wall biosynthesis
MACGKAAVIGIRGEAEAILEGAGAGLAFDPDDDARLAAHVETLIDDPERRAAMGRGGCREARERFSLEQSQATLRGLLAGVAQHKAGA